MAERAKSPPLLVADDHMPKRISTPAGERLTAIMEDGAFPADGSKRGSSRLSMHRKSAGLGLPPGRGSYEKAYTTIWSDANGSSGQSSEKSWVKNWRENNVLTRRGGWMRLLLLILLFIIIVIAVVIGVVFGLKSHNSKHNISSPTQTAGGDSSPSPSPTAPSNADATPTHTASGSPSSKPSNFPIGTYSIITYLSTVETNCTSNPDTWTCFPYSTYGQDQTKSMTTFNWNITAGSSSGTYKISSVDDPFAITFSNVDLNILDQGQDSERYTFQTTIDKQVIPTSNLTADDSSTTCFFNSTTYQATLYSKMAKNYPPSGMQDSSASYTTWPYAVRVEEVAGGGDNVPNCYKTNNNVIGQQVQSSTLTSQDAGALCDCLYLNWFP